MKKNITVLGCGLVGTTLVRDLASEPNVIVTKPPREVPIKIARSIPAPSSRSPALQQIEQRNGTSRKPNSG